MRLPALSALIMLLAACRRAPDTVEPVAPEPAPVFVEQPAAAPEPEPPPRHSESIASFESFMGLRYGDTAERVHDLFGEPTYSETGDDLDTLYYVMTEDTLPDDGPPGAGDDFLFVITVDNGSGLVFNIQANPGNYAENGIDDPLLRFVGAPLSEIEASFGAPSLVESGFNTYEYVDEQRNFEMEVEFVCYDFDDYVCRELWVTWFEP